MVGRALRSIRAHLDEDRPHSGRVADLSIEKNEDQVVRLMRPPLYKVCV